MIQQAQEHPGLEVSRLLMGAAKTITATRYCWLTTTAENGGINARPMGRLLRDPIENGWTIRFILDGRSRKAFDIRRAPKISAIFQRDADEALVTLAGTAVLHEDAAQIRPHWKDAYNMYFPTEQDRANAALIEINSERMELWIRGVTPEPFGLQPTVLQRDAAGEWRL